MPTRKDYSKLGNFLKEARLRTYSSRALVHSVSLIANQLGVTKGFVYQVEDGIRKPKDGDFGRWASVYGVRFADIWKCLDSIPMDLVASFRSPEQPPISEQYQELNDIEKEELLPFIKYIKWKLYQETGINSDSKHNKT